MRNCVVLLPKGWNETIQYLEKLKERKKKNLFPEGFLNFWVDLQIVWVNTNVILFWQRHYPTENIAWPQLYFAACFSHQSGYRPFPAGRSSTGTSISVLALSGHPVYLQLHFLWVLRHCWMQPGLNEQNIGVLTLSPEASFLHWFQILFMKKSALASLTDGRFLQGGINRAQ